MSLQKWMIIIGIMLHVLPLSVQATEKKITPEKLPGVTIIEPEKVKQWLDSGVDFLIIDARKAADYDAGHLPDAELCTVPSELNISEKAITKSIDALSKYDVLQDLEKDTKIITYCNNYT